MCVCSVDLRDEARVQEKEQGKRPAKRQLVLQTERFYSQLQFESSALTMSTLYRFNKYRTVRRELYRDIQAS